MAGLQQTTPPQSGGVSLLNHPPLSLGAFNKKIRQKLKSRNIADGVCCRITFYCNFQFSAITLINFVSKLMLQPAPRRERFLFFTMFPGLNPANMNHYATKHSLSQIFVLNCLSIIAAQKSAGVSLRTLSGILGSPSIILY